jgi:hypothetical protein
LLYAKKVKFPTVCDYLKTKQLAKRFDASALWAQRQGGNSATKPDSELQIPNAITGNQAVQSLRDFQISDSGQVFSRRHSGVAKHLSVGQVDHDEIKAEILPRYTPVSEPNTVDNSIVRDN